MSRRQTIWINCAALAAGLTAALALYGAMRGSFGARIYSRTLLDGATAERVKAASALQEMGPKGAPAVPALLTILANSRDPSAAACANALREIDAQAAYDYASSLIARIERAEEPLTPLTVDLFQSLGPIAWHAIPLLEPHLRGPHIRSLVPALIDMGDYSDAVVASIVQDSRDPVYSTTKWDAMLAFDRLGARALPLKPELERLAQDPTPAVVGQAKVMLSHFTRPWKFETSGLRGFSSQGLPYQEYSLDKLSKLGAAAADAIPEILVELHSQSPLLRFMAAWTLGHIGPPAQSALPDLRAAISDPSSLVRDGVAEAIRSIQAQP